MALLPSSLGQEEVDPLEYTEPAGGLSPPVRPGVLRPTSMQVTPPSLLSRGAAVVKDFFTSSPEPQEGDPDFSRVLPPTPPPVTDLSQEFKTTDELEEMAGTPGVLQTIGREVGTREGLWQKVGVLGRARKAVPAVQAMIAMQRQQSGHQYATPEDEEADLKKFITWANTSRLEQAQQQRSTLPGKAVGYVLRSFPFMQEIALSLAIGRKFGMKAAAGAGAQTVEMTAARLGATRWLNQFIGKSGERMVANRMREIALKEGRNVAYEVWRTGSVAAQKEFTREARLAVAKNVANRAQRTLDMVGVDVAKNLMKDHVALRIGSRAIEQAIRLPIIDPGGLIGGTAVRQLNRTGVTQDPVTGKVTFQETGETLTESALKNATSEYIEYLSEFSGGLLGEVFRKMMPRHLASLKVAELASKLRGGGPVSKRLGTVMGSKFVTRGLLVHGRFMEMAASKAAVYGPIEEVGEEILAKIGNSVLNLDDDGVTPWATRVFKSTLFPIFEPRETLAMLLGFSIIPGGSFAVGAATGMLTDQEVELKNKLVNDVIRGNSPIGYVDRKDVRNTMKVLLDHIKMEEDTGLNTSLIGYLSEKLFGKILIRPDTATDLTFQWAQGLKTMGADALATPKALRSALIEAPREKAISLLTNILDYQSDAAIVDRETIDLSDTDWKAAASLVEEMNRLQYNIFQRLPDLIGPERMKEQIRELSGTPLVTKERTVISDLLPEEVGRLTTELRQPLPLRVSLPRATQLMEVTQAVLQQAELTPAARADLTTQLEGLRKTTDILASGRGDIVKLGSRLHIMYGSEQDVAELEKRGGGVFSQRQVVATPQDVKKIPNLKASAQGVLESLLTHGKLAKEFDLFNINPVDLELTKAGLIARGLSKEAVGRSTAMPAFLIPASKGQKARLYFTKDASGLEIIHEIAHRGRTSEKGGEKIVDRMRSIVAYALETFAKGERTVSGKTGFGLPDLLRDDLFYTFFPKYGKKTPAFKDAEVEWVLGKLRKGKMFYDKGIPYRFEELMANLLGVYTGHTADVENRGELKTARHIHQVLSASGNKWYRAGMEEMIRSAPILQAPGLHRTPLGDVELAAIKEQITKLAAAEKPAPAVTTPPSVKQVAKETPVLTKVKPKTVVVTAPVVKTTRPKMTKVEGIIDEIGSPEGQEPDELEPGEPGGAAKPKRTVPKIEEPKKVIVKTEEPSVPVSEVAKPAVPVQEKVAVPAAPTTEATVDDFTGEKVNIRTSLVTSKVISTVEDREDSLVSTARVLSLFSDKLRVAVIDDKVNWLKLRDAMIAWRIDKLFNDNPERIAAWKQLRSEDFEKEAVLILTAPAQAWRKALSEKITKLQIIALAADDLRGALAKEGLLDIAEAGQDEKDMPESAAGEMVNYFLENRSSRAMTKTNDRFLNGLDLTYGVDNAYQHTGSREWLLRMHQHTQGVPFLQLTFKELLRTEKDFNRAISRPEEFLKEQAEMHKIKSVPEDLLRFWLDHVVPTFRSYSYEELTVRRDGFTLEETLQGQGLSRRLQFNEVGKYTGSRLQITNRSHAEAQEAMRTMSPVVVGRAAWIKQQTGSHVEAWAQWFKDLRQAAQGDQVKSSRPEDVKNWMLANINSPSEDGLKVWKDVLRMADKLFPLKEAGLDLDTVGEMLGDGSIGRDMRVSLAFFFVRLDANSIEKGYSDAGAIFNLNRVITDTRRGLAHKVFAAARHKLNPFTELGLWSSAFGKRRDARVNSGLQDRFNRQTNLRILKHFGLIRADRTDLEVEYLDSVLVSAPGQPMNTDSDWEAAPNTVEVSGMTGIQREDLAKQLLANRFSDKEGNQYFMAPLSPMGATTTFAITPVRYFTKPAELSAKYAEVYKAFAGKAKEFGSMDQWLTPEEFDADLKTRKHWEQMHLSLYQGLLGRMVAGKEEEFDSVLDYLKRSKASFGIPNSSDVIRIFPVTNMQADLTPEGMSPSKNGPVKLFDGFQMLTTVGRNKIAGGNATSSKSVISGLGKFWSRTLNKGNQIYVNSKTVEGLDPALVDLWKAMEDHNEEHPDNQCDLISVMANQKVMPDNQPGAKNGFPALTYDAKGLHFHANVVADLSNKLQEVPGDYSQVMSHLSESTEPGELTVPVLMLSSNPVQGAKLAWDILRQATMDNWDGLPSWKGSLKDLQENLPKYLREDNENDRRILAALKLGVDVRDFPGKYGEPSLMIVARMRNRLAGLNGVRSQHTPNLLTPVTLPKGLIKDVLDTRAYMWRAKDGKIQQSTQMKDIPANVRVYGNPAGLAANIKGVPVTERKTLYSTNPNGKEVIIAAVWNMNRPDVFESELDETPGSESVQLKKEFLPDIEEALDIKSRKKGNTWEHSFTLRGALVAGDNSPNTGPESTVLFRLERQVGAGEKSNFQMMNNRLVVLAGRDFDGDAQANAVVKRGKDGKLTGPRGDFVDASGKIPLTLEAGATWSPDATVTAAQFVFSRGMIYLSDSPEYFNPGRGLDPYNRRIHNEEVFKPIALKQQEKLLKKLGKWNSLESVFFMLRMPGDLAKALSVVARHRQVWLQIFRNKLALRTPVGFNIKGIDVPPDEGHTHTFELGKDEVMGDLRADAITDFSGDVFGLTADQLKDFFAPSLHINANTLKYIYSILMSNYRLIRVPKLKKNESPAEMLKSVMGTIELLQGTLLTDEEVKLPAVSKGFASLSQMAESFRLLDLFDRYRDLGTKERVAQIREAKLPANQADNVFDIPDALRRVPEWQLTLAGVDKLDSLLPDETKLMSVADLISGQSEDFQKNRETYLLEVWNHLSDNLFARSLRAVLDTQKNKYPAINRPAMSTLEQDAVSASFLKLPSRTQLALIIFAYEKWGMSKYDPESYVSILPDEAMLRLQGMLGKSVKALVGQEAAALAPGRTVQPVPAATKAPSAPVSETQSFLKANQKHIASDEQKFSDTIKASLVTSRVIPEAMNLPGLNVRQKLQENMRTRVTFVDRLVRMVGLATFVMRRNSGRELPEAVQARSAIPYYLDSGMDLKAKLRTKDNVGMDLTVELVDGVPKLTKTPVDLDDVTVGDAFKAYEKLRARSPERLVPWQELLPEGIKVTKDVLDAVNKHAAEAGIPEMVDDITKRLRAVTGKEGTVYVHHGTLFPLTDMGERIQETMLKFFTAPAEEREFGVTIRVTPQDVTTTRTKTTPLTAAMKYLNELSAEKREAEVARLVESVPETLREYSILQETTGITQLRKIATLDEKFKKYGVILRNPDYADLLDQYVAEIANYAADRRMLTLFFNATDYAGIPAAMISQRTPANEPGKRPPKEQTLLSRDALFTMFVNWRRRLQMDGIAVEPFDPAKTHWENLDRLESLATKGWFTDNGYEYTELKNVEGFSHAWVQKGAPIQLLKHITSRGIGDWPDEGPIGVVKKMLQGLLWFNQVTKQTALSFSLFHSGSLLESHGAAYGLTLKNPFLNPWQLVKDLWAMRTMAKQTLTDPKMRGLMSLWMEANLEFRFSDRDPLEAEKRGEGGALDEGMTAIIDRSNKVAMLRPVGKSMHAVRSIKRKMDRLLWEVQQPASKLMLAERIFSEALSNPDYAEIADSPGGEMKIRKEIARLVNQQFGGLDWREMLWATPTARDFLRLAFFAPDWTFANLQVAMVPDFLQRITGVRMPFGPVSTTDIRSKELLNKYWPAYITLVFGWLPMVWQFAIYGAFGDPDKGDKPLIFMNEEGRDNAIDVTPFMRRLGKRFGITEKRRVYLQWGKQAREILNWFQDPLKTGLGKTSMSAKAAYEQITGRNTAGWNLPWTRDDDTSFLASWFVVDGKMSDSRLSYVFQKFVPMTIQSWVDSNRPPTIFAPMKLGMSSFTAERVIADVLQAYGDEGFRMWLSGRPERVKRLETLVIGTLDAAWLNGYPVKTIMSRAKGMAHRAQTKRFFDVLEANPKNPDVAKLEIAARALLRTGDTAKKLYNRIEYKYTQRGRVMTDAQREALFEAERNAQEKLGE